MVAGSPVSCIRHRLKTIPWALSKRSRRSVRAMVSAVSAELRDPEEVTAKRGLAIDHSMIALWVLYFS